VLGLMKYTPKQINFKKYHLARFKKTFPDCVLVIYRATPEQIEQLKAAGLSGVNRQRDE
jgi:hypothetical protein